MRYEQGFSMIKMMFWGAVVSAAVVYAYMVIPVYNAYWKVQDTFEGVVHSMSDSDERAILRRLPDLFHIKYLAPRDVPQEFYDNLDVKSDAGNVEISSSYHVTIWFIGPVEGVDPNSDYEENDLKGMDKLRAKLRQDFDFDPYAATSQKP